MLWTILPPLVAAGLWWLTLAPRTVATQQFLNTGDERRAAVPTRAELADLQRMADAACRCSRAQAMPSGEQCWDEYRRSSARFEGWSYGTLCAEESVEGVCFGPDGPDQLCVSTSRPYGACSDAEARTRLAEARRRQSSIHC